jgi:hypothetical protein
VCWIVHRKDKSSAMDPMRHVGNKDLVVIATEDEGFGYYVGRVVPQSLHKNAEVRWIITIINSVMYLAAKM